MNTLEITKEAALKAHTEANDKGKTLLENLLGKKIFVIDIREKVKTFEDAVNELGESDPDVIDFQKIQSLNLQIHIVNNLKAIIIVKALNEGWIPDWTNSSQYKYFPWWKMGSSSGVGFSYYDYDYWNSYSNVGSRLALKNSDLAKYVGVQFPEVYKGFMTI